MRTKKNQKRKSSLTTLVNLLPEEVKHLSKPREGFTNYAPPLIKLYAEHVVQMPIKGMTPEGANQLLEAYEELVAAEKAAQKQLDMIQATRALRASELWNLELRIYAHASVAGRDDVELARDIGEFEHFMKNGPRKKEETTPPVTPPTKPTP